MRYSKMCIKTERWKPCRWQTDARDVVKETEWVGSWWCRCQVRTGAWKRTRPDRFQSGTSRPSLAADSRPSWSPTLPLTPSFTRAAWRWRAGGLHSDTHEGARILIHTQTCRHPHREKRVLNLVLKDLGDGGESRPPGQVKILGHRSEVCALNSKYRMKLKKLTLFGFSYQSWCFNSIAF